MVITTIVIITTTVILNIRITVPHIRLIHTRRIPTIRPRPIAITLTIRITTIIRLTLTQLTHIRPIHILTIPRTRITAIQHIAIAILRTATTHIASRTDIADKLSGPHIDMAPMMNRITHNINAA
jgi:hypothetical protein